jgi:hypothetical protein
VETQEFKRKELQRMNAIEFKTWWEFHGSVFPETAVWMNSLGSDGKRKLMAAWEEAMRDVETVDALKATRRMLAGDDEFIHAYERERTPAHIRRIAMRLKSERLTMAKTESQNREARATKMIKELRKKGMIDEEEIIKVLQEKGLEWPA